MIVDDRPDDGRTQRRGSEKSLGRDPGDAGTEAVAAGDFPVKTGIGDRLSLDVESGRAELQRVPNEQLGGGGRNLDPQGQDLKLDPAMDSSRLRVDGGDTESDGGYLSPRIDLQDVFVIRTPRKAQGPQDPSVGVPCHGAQLHLFAGDEPRPRGGNVDARNPRLGFERGCRKSQQQT